jgi:hypothetical protein
MNMRRRVSSGRTWMVMTLPTILVGQCNEFDLDEIDEILMETILMTVMTPDS